MSAKGVADVAAEDVHVLSPRFLEVPSYDKPFGAEGPPADRTDPRVLRVSRIAPRTA